MSGVIKTALTVATLAILPGTIQAEDCAEMGATQFIDGMRLCASSVYPPEGRRDYGPGNLLDGDAATAWCEGTPGTAGEYLVISVHGGPEFRVLWFQNGYAASSAAFSRNARPRVIEIVTEAGHRSTHLLPDHIHEAPITLPIPARDQVTIWIRDVYPGTHHHDTCLNGVSIDFEFEGQLLRQASTTGKKPSNSANTGCEFLEIPNAGIPGHNREFISGITDALCRGECNDRDWCKSVDFERANGTCYLQPVGRHDVELKTDYSGNPYDHYSCENR